MVALLESFKANPTQTRNEIRRELGCVDELAAEVFALVVFLCDGLLELGEEEVAGHQPARFSGS